ncbi:MAG: DUF5916 domain-containing protein [Balneola sp.]
MKYFLLLVSAMLFNSKLVAQEQSIYENFILNAVKINAKVIIDGELEESEWGEASITSDFLNKAPRDTGLAVNQTKAWIMYDDEFLYIGAINYQKKEDLVIKTLKRDNSSYHWDSDGFSVVLDPMNKQTNGFLFGVNAAGARVDGMVSIENSRTRPDVNWDNVWYSSVKVHDDYWVAEFAIPFKSINYDTNVEEWGINFVRNDMKRNEYSTWSHVPLGFPGIDIGHLGTMVIKDIPPKRKQGAIIQPYVLGSSNKDFLAANNGLENDIEIGLDAKIPVGQNLKLDLTVNPDFSTVDVDQQVTNLSRFSIFFPEKRAFFLENSDLFGSFGTWGLKPFFSRRIGLNNGEIVPILFGARVTGNLSEDLRVGVLNAHTRSVNDLSANNYTVASVQQNLIGRTNVKALFTNRSSFDGASPTGEDYNRTIGAEFNYTSENGYWNGNARYHWSQTEEKFDDAYFAGATLMYGDGDKFFGITADRVEDNYINELGFSDRLFQYDAEAEELKRVGYNFINPWAGFTIRPNADWINSYTFSGWMVGSSRTNGDFIDRILSVNFEMYTKDWGGVNLSARNSKIALLFPTNLINGEELLPVDTYNFSRIAFDYYSDTRGIINGSLNTSFGEFYNGTRTQFGGSLNMRVQPWGNFGVRYIGNKVTLPDNYGEATLHLIGPQAEVSFSNNLSWTSFLQYNTQAENFNVNSRLQWRFASMSDLFIVYNDNYATDNFAVKNRGVVFKMNYWFN